MLRTVGAGPGAGKVALEALRVSSGSAVVLGLESWRVETAPTTAYLMVGERCGRDCAFCAQARHSQASADLLSRVSWPSYPADDVVRGVAAAYERGAIVRSCLQVTSGPGHLSQTRAVVRGLKAASAVPLCVSIRATGLQQFSDLVALGVERVTLALDAASERVYNRVKGRDWHKALELLRAAAQCYPGRVGTHVIVGLGETENEAAALLQAMHDEGILAALFALTPVAGTALAEHPPPPLDVYRRVQVARHVIARGLARAEQFRYAADGRIEAYGIAVDSLRELLADGQAFETSGCTGCNRPYYNERPGGPLYNYPRRLQREEILAATALVIAGLADR